jgi:hypothetical protein
VVRPRVIRGRGGRCRIGWRRGLFAPGQRSKTERWVLTGSGPTKDEIKEDVNNVVVKKNVDSDTQFAYLIGFRDFALVPYDGG